MLHRNTFEWAIEEIDFEARVWLYSWTFDPTHNGHLEVVKEATKQVDFLLINPCDRNPSKIYTRSDLARRKKWIRLWVEEYWYNELPLILVDDALYRTEVGSLDEVLQWEKGRVRKIIWPDKIPNEHPFPLVIWEERLEGRSSTLIKQRLNNGDIQGLEFIMPPSIIDDILQSGFKFE